MCSLSLLCWLEKGIYSPCNNWGLCVCGWFLCRCSPPLHSPCPVIDSCVQSSFDGPLFGTTYLSCLLLASQSLKAYRLLFCIPGGIEGHWQGTMHWWWLWTTRTTFKVRDPLIMFPLDCNSRSTNEIYGNVPSRLPRWRCRRRRNRHPLSSWCWRGKRTADTFQPWLPGCEAPKLNQRIQFNSNPPSDRVDASLQLCLKDFVYCWVLTKSEDIVFLSED